MFLRATFGPRAVCCACLIYGMSRAINEPGQQNACGVDYRLVTMFEVVVIEFVVVTEKKTFHREKLFFLLKPFFHQTSQRFKMQKYWLK